MARAAARSGPEKTGRANRLQPRFDLRLRVTLSFAGHDHECLSLDLSWGGACLSAPTRFALEPGDHTGLAVYPARDAEAVKIAAETRWIVTSGNSLLIGVRFLGDAERERMMRVVNRLQAANTNERVLADLPTFDPRQKLSFKGFSGTDTVPAAVVRAAVLASMTLELEDMEVASPTAEGGADQGGAHLLLNPNGSAPLGLNLVLPRNLVGDHEIVTLTRHAIARARYPRFDGPPQTVTVAFVLRKTAAVEIDDFDDL